MEHQQLASYIFQTIEFHKTQKSTETHPQQFLLFFLLYPNSLLSHIRIYSTCTSYTVTLPIPALSSYNYIHGLKQPILGANLGDLCLYLLTLSCIHLKRSLASLGIYLRV